MSQQRTFSKRLSAFRPNPAWLLWVILWTLLLGSVVITVQTGSLYWEGVGGAMTVYGVIKVVARSRRRASTDEE